MNTFVTGGNSGSTRRRRLVAVADAERQRLERALHDGVQQDLIAVLVRLQLAERLPATDREALLAVLDEIGRDVQEALDRVRALANNVYPSLLETLGLREALRSAAAASGIAATVEAPDSGRYPADVEAALFFCCRASLDQLAASRDAGARATIRIDREERALRLAVHGGGVELDGGADAFVLVRERIEVLGGVLTFDPASGGSERLVATVPLA
jgi:signal transduction histidine kinase